MARGNHKAAAYAAAIMAALKGISVSELGDVPDRDRARITRGAFGCPPQVRMGYPGAKLARRVLRNQRHPGPRGY